MTALGEGAWLRPALPPRAVGWRNRLVASRRFQSWASRMPLIRGLARKDGERLFDLMAGFVYSQVLLATVELGVLETLRSGPLGPDEMAAPGIPEGRFTELLMAAASLGLIERRRDGRFQLGRLGAAVLGVPGLEAMIRHHRMFYRDLADPESLLRGGETELAHYWPYVRGEVAGPAAATYSELMAVSQTLVAEETLRAVSFRGRKRLMDVGGGTGMFLSEVARAWPDLDLTLLDLPAVVAAAGARFGEGARIRTVGGSFLDPLPRDADAISLVRVLYDHEDATVERLLARVHEALPPGGMLVVSEPMSGGARPDRFTDGYFAFYTMAMGTGHVRSPGRISALLEAAGFMDLRAPRVSRPFITQVITARRPG